MCNVNTLRELCCHWELYIQAGQLSQIQFWASKIQNIIQKIRNIKNSLTLATHQEIV